MGVLNATPDSFFDGGRFQAQADILAQVEKMLKEGADIIDIGGMSSRPGARIISEEEELRRVLPAVVDTVEHFPEAILSVDTVRSRVAREAIAAGAHLINDISAGSIDGQMYEAAADLDVPYILMHMRGAPENMQKSPQYEDVVREILDFFIAEVGKLRALKVKDIIIDPGFGFGKTLAHNYQLLAKLHVFNILELPVLTGISRKGMIYKLLETTPEAALNGTSALHMIALQQGSRLLRVHDVREAKEVIRLWEQLEAVGR
jgi:dihydropteroate synthase